MHKQLLKKSPLFLFFLLFFYLLLPLPKEKLSEKNPIILIANQCDDDIHSTFVNAIKKAKRSIYLNIYSLNDPLIIKALKQKQAEKITISIRIDPQNCKGLDEIKNLIIPHKTSGLMHQKILIIDEQEVWIGSANFTSSSLMTHDNLIISLYSKEIAGNLINQRGGHFYVGNQQIDLFYLPQEKKKAFSTLVTLLENAQSSLHIAMFTWTHPLLTQKVIDAQNRGVNVSCILDYNSGVGVSKKVRNRLISEEVAVKLNNGSPLLHHKCCYIDNSILILGSANWTKAAFSKNDECILIIYNLNSRQQKKMTKFWHALRSTSL